MNGRYELEKTLEEAFWQADAINERVTRVIPVTCDEIDRECLQLIKEWKKK